MRVITYISDGEFCRLQEMAVQERRSTGCRLQPRIVQQANGFGALPRAAREQI